MVRVPITTTIDEKYKSYADKLDIPMSRILEFGIHFKYAEHCNTVDGIETIKYPENAISGKLMRCMALLEQTSADKHEYADRAGVVDETVK